MMKQINFAFINISRVLTTTRRINHTFNASLSSSTQLSSAPRLFWICSAASCLNVRVCAGCDAPPAGFGLRQRTDGLVFMKPFYEGTRFLTAFYSSCITKQLI